MFILPENDQNKLQEDLVAEQAGNRADHLPKRKAPSCKKCGQLMKRHSRTLCKE